MWLTKLISKIKRQENPKPKIKTVKDLDLMDDIWIKEDNEIYTGWIWDISRRCITVIYGEDLRDYKFQIPRPMNVPEIRQDNKILYCNEPNDV